jgi:diguanylate cyclase (GGDEF)-like protein
VIAKAPRQKPRREVNLPSIPLVAMRLLEAYADPDLPLDRIVAIIKADPAITAKVLKYANSSLYSKGRIDSLNQAVLWLGRHTLTCLVLSFSLTEDAQKPGTYASVYQEYWLQSVIQGLAMQIVTRRLEPVLADAAFVTGLLMDIGRLAMLRKNPDQYAALCGAARLKQCPIRELEVEKFQETHAAVSAEMLTNWRFADETVWLTRLHDLNVEDVLQREQEEAFERLVVANIASAVGDFLVGISPAQSLKKLQKLASVVLGMTDHDIDVFLDEVRARLAETSELLSTDLSQLPPPSELLASAMEELLTLSMNADGPGTREASAAPEVHQENKSLRARINELERKTCVDELTGLYTRDYFQRRLLQRLQASSDQVGRTAVLFLDLDKFKRVNDVHGHHAGDLVLQTVATIMQDAVRGTDVVARYGGEEFVVLMQCRDAEGARSLAERIRSNVARSVIDVGGLTLRITVSVGGAVYDVQVDDPQRGCSRLVTAADEAMYEVKRAGGNGTLIRCLSEAALNAAVAAPTT